MKIFKLNKDWSVVCENKETRNGLCHVGTVTNKDGCGFYKVRCSYSNRTWEMYEYQYILKLATNYLERTVRISKNMSARIRNKIETGGF